MGSVAKFLAVLTCLLVFPVLAAPRTGNAQVTVHDAVAATGREVMLRADTGSGFFGKGGVLVEFFVDGRRAGKNLSGGDGAAFLSFVPRAARLHRLRAEAEGGSAEGLLLAVKQSAELVMIEVEGGLIERSLTMKPRPGSVEAVKRIGRRYPVVYLATGFFGLAGVKALLKERGFPEAPLLSAAGGALFEAVKGKRLKIRAVIGSPDLVKAAREYTRLAFSFESTGEADAAEDWEEIVRRMR